VDDALLMQPGRAAWQHVREIPGGGYSSQHVGWACLVPLPPHCTHPNPLSCPLPGLTLPCTCWSARQSCTNLSITLSSLSSAPCRPRTSLSRSPSCGQWGRGQAGYACSAHQNSACTQ
jgi:hypothetical protein